jgi:hypothetical protein
VDKRFADLRENAVAAIRAWGEETGTADATLTRIVESLLPSIRLVPRKGGTSRQGGSRIGGLPDLPAGVPWPLRAPARGRSPESPPMSFVLQVNLAEVAELDANKVLPPEGLLTLFYYWDDDAGGDAGRILFFPAPLPELRRPTAPTDLDEEGRYRAFSLEPRAEWTLPDRTNLGVEEEPDLEAWFTLRDAVEEAQGLRERTGVHRLLGHPNWIQSSVLDEGDVLLLQADSDDSEDGPGISWGDGGRVFCTLSEADLRAGKLDRASIIMDMA